MKKMMMIAAVCIMAVMTFAAQCAATTKKCTQCKCQVSSDSKYCWQHGGTIKAERTAGGDPRSWRSYERKVNMDKIEINRESERYLHPDGQSYDPSTNFFVTWFEQPVQGELGIG